jgi:dethiobiotin synthetase
VNLFITGTDTNVGKTYISTLLVRTLRAAGKDAVGMKAMSCGDRSDARSLHAACDGAAPLDDINPVWFNTAVAPRVAAKLEGRTIDLAPIRAAYARLCAAHEVVIVEGLGGWRVPIAHDFSLSDLAVEFALPVVVVAANRLGAINHTLLTVESIRAHGLKCAGIILNRLTPGEADVATRTNREVIAEFAGVPILAEVEFGATRIEWPLLHG